MKNTLLTMTALTLLLAGQTAMASESGDAEENPILNWTPHVQSTQQSSMELQYPKVSMRVDTRADLFSIDYDNNK